MTPTGAGETGGQALLVVDVQVGAVRAGPYEIRRVLDNIASLIDACRTAGVPVVFVQHDGRPGEAEEPHTDGWEIHPDIAPRPGETVIRKRFNSAFRETELHRHLQGLGLTRLMIVGIQTEYCVDTTVRVAFESGYTVVLPEWTNTTFDNGPVPAREVHELFNRRIFHGRFATVVPMDEALRTLV